MARKNAYLIPGQFLLEGDYMVASNGIFYAILQGDGNFVVYPGTGPDGRQGGALWYSGPHARPAGTTFSLDMQPDGNLVMYTNPGNVGVWSSGTSGTNYALMQQNGEFVIYAGAPGSGGPAVWRSNVSYTMTRMEVFGVSYDLARATLSDPQVAAYVEQVYRNDSSIDQQQIFQWEVAYEEARSWSSSLGGSIGIAAEFKGGVPLVGPEGKVTISASVTFEETVGGESRKVETLTGTFPLTVPPFTHLEASTVVTVAAVTVPYTANAKYFFDNGVVLQATVNGVFAGSSKYRVETAARPAHALRAQAALGPSLRSREAALVSAGAAD